MQAADARAGQRHGLLRRDGRAGGGTDDRRRLAPGGDPVAASLLLAFAAGRCGKRLGLCWFFAVALLSLLLTQDKEAALVFLCLGYYPLLRSRLQRLACRPVRLAVKLAVFLAGSAAALAAAWLILGLPWRETAGLLALAVAAFGLYDLLLGRLARRFAKM